MNNELKRTPLTFPVTTACFAKDKDGAILDKDFLTFISKANLDYGFINIYCGETSTLSSCCFGGDQKVLTKSSNGVALEKIKEIVKGSNFEEYRKNFTVFHNGSWVKAKPVILPIENHKMFKITTANNKEMVVTDNHINLTDIGDVETSKLTTDNYIAFSSKELNSYPEKDKKLTYDQGFLIGAYAGDGSKYKRKDSNSFEVTFSFSESKMKNVKFIKKALDDWGIDKEVKIYYGVHNVVFVKILSEELYDIINEYIHGDYANTKTFDCNILLQSRDFRSGIVAGWYASDGGNSSRIYSVSEALIETGEAIFTSLGVPTIINCEDRTDEAVNIRGEEYNRNYPTYCIRLYDQKNKRSVKDVYKVRNNTTYFKIKSIEPYDYEDDKVYCFEVANTDEPYFTLPNGAITHNCRLRSERKSEYFNTFGAGSTKIGSLGVVTLNLPRLAYETKVKYNSNIDLFLSTLKAYYHRTAIINSCKRKIIGKLIEDKAQPLYDIGFMELSKQYSTCGINGLYEALEILGYDILTEEGQQLTEKILTTLGNCCTDAEEKYKAPHNLEQVPAESSAVKLAQKDHYFEINTEYELYSNQFIPLIANTDMLNRIHLQGKFDKLFSGGAICHINVSEKLTNPDDMSNLIEYASQCGVVYFAINYRLKQCANKHLWVGTEHCPTCGGDVTDEFTRVVGFLTKVANWNKTRKTVDYPNRQFYTDIKI